MDFVKLGEIVLHEVGHGDVIACATPLRQVEQDLFGLVYRKFGVMLGVVGELGDLSAC